MFYFPLQSLNRLRDIRVGKEIHKKTQ